MIIKQTSRFKKWILIRLKRMIEGNPGDVKPVDSGVYDVETIGIMETRRIAGYHDEPVAWYRSVRLSKSYRAYYTEKDGSVIQNNCIDDDLIHK